MKLFSPWVKECMAQFLSATVVHDPQSLTCDASVIAKRRVVMISCGEGITLWDRAGRQSKLKGRAGTFQRQGTLACC